MNKKLLILSISLITLGLVLMSNAIASAQGNEFTIPFSDPAKRGKVKVHINYGSITIKGTARKDVLVKYKEARDEECDDCDDDHDHDHGHEDHSKSKEGLKRIAGGGMELEVVENNNFVQIESGSWNNKLDLEVEVPSGVDLEADTYNDGDLMVTNIQGQLELNNYNGEITALNISGSVVATTYNGEIKVTFDKVTEATPMSFSTYNGDIDLTFPSALNATLKMKTEQGEIFTGFDIKVTSSGPVQVKDNKSGVYKLKIDEWKRADVGGGGAEFTLKNYNGDIYIRKK